MENAGFARTIKNTNDVEYHLPEAEYDYEGNVTRKDVMNKAKKAADKTGNEYSILVTESNGRTWFGLEKV
jgi:hypothetical protein